MSEHRANVVDVTDATFEQVVVEGSRERPVVVDLWAEWCGPCRTLGPILEKIAEERDGAFLLAKLDTDANPMTSAAFGVQSIPTVIAFRDGKAITGFIGAYPEPAVNEFVDTLLPTEAELVADEAAAVAEAGDVAAAERGFREALEKDPKSAEAAVGLARLLLAEGRTDEAGELVAPHLPDPEAERVHAQIEVTGWAALPANGTLASAKRLAAGGRWREAFDGMLGALQDDRDDARQAMLTAFSALGDEDELVVEYRRRLTNALY